MFFVPFQINTPHPTPALPHFSSAVMNSPRKRQRRYQQAWRRAKKLTQEAHAAAEEMTREEDIVHSTLFQNEEAECVTEVDKPQSGEGGDNDSSKSEEEAVERGDDTRGFSTPDSWSELSDESDSDIDAHGIVPEVITASQVVQRWALRHGITHNALDDLLREVRQVNPLESWRELPLSARTLLRTKRTVVTDRVGPMERIKLDVESVVASNFLKYPAEVRAATHSIPVILSTDGMPVYNSANKNLWPLLCAIQLQPPCVFPLSLTIGPPKPPSASFLTDTLIDVVRLLANGIQVDDRTIPVELKCVVADAPARALIKGTVQFNSASGCDKCATRAQWTYSRDSDNEAAAAEREQVAQAEREGRRRPFIRRKRKGGGRSTFQAIENLEPRTDLSFRQQADESHHKVPSPFLMLPVDMIKDFPIDYMHQVCLGVMKKLLHQWFQERIRLRSLSALSCERADGRLVAMRPHLPSEFARKPRSLSELKHWKATEFRQFLLYTGRSVLEGLLSQQQYENFLALSVACLILVSPALTRQFVEQARSLLKYFVQSTRAVYGKKWLHYNIHAMLHLADEGERYGCLDACSAFPFENHLYKMKKMVRGGKQPLVQLFNRLGELEVSPCSLVAPNKRPVTTKSPNNHYVLANNRCVSVAVIDGQECICRDFGIGRPAFHRPMNSTRLGIFRVRAEPIALCRQRVADLTRKAMCLPTSEGLLFQLMHHDTTN